jgi:hypothetical protein
MYVLRTSLVPLILCSVCTEDRKAALSIVRGIHPAVCPRRANWRMLIANHPDLAKK